MTTNKVNAYQQLLGKLAAGVQRGDTSALDQITELLAKQPREPNLLHLAGLYHLNTGTYTTAIDYFQQSLVQVAAQPELHNNLANAYRATQNYSAAQRHYSEAIALQPNYRDAHKNLGLLLIQLEEFDGAEKALLAALKITPKDVSVLTGLGDLYRAQHAYEKANEYYQQALVITPDYPNALHNMGSSYKALERPQEALQLYARAQQSAPHRPEIDLSIGSTLFDQGDYRQAETHFLHAIKKAPQMVEAHETLSELYWQTGRHEEVEKSFREALDAAPANMAMRIALLKHQISSGRFEHAKRFAAESLRIESNAELQYLQGKLFANELDYPRAKECFERALGEAQNLDCAQDLVKLNILQADYQAALSLIDNLQLEYPDDQLSWALKGLCWRLLGDERYEWLIDYNAFIKSYVLPTPAGYSQLADFLAELESTLLAMHSAQFAPSQQTLKGGTQTPGRLLHKRHPVIQGYKALLTDVVTDFIETLPSDSGHPLLGRKSSRFEFSGSWSVKLAAGGFHVNHVHPQGWISSACYISLPDNGLQPGSEQACIKFGESGLGLGERETIERVIRPKAGMLVLFPSYTWHGTFDFTASEDAFRLTAPFDVVPV